MPTVIVGNHWSKSDNYVSSESKRGRVSKAVSALRSVGRMLNMVEIMIDII